MRFLVDAQLPPGLSRWLTGHGYAADHVAAVGSLAATDQAIAAAAEALDAALISKDEDFLILRHPDRFAFLWLRIGNAANRALPAWLEPRSPAIERLLIAGERLVEVR